MDFGAYVCNMLAQGLGAAWHSFYDIVGTTHVTVYAESHLQ